MIIPSMQIKQIKLLVILGTIIFGMSALSIPEIDAAKSQGKSGWRYGSATANIVCGDRLCSESKTEFASNETVFVKNPSPIEQFKRGTFPSDVICNSGFSLVIKNSDGTPACLFEDSIKILFSRGWASPVMLN